MSKIYTLIQDLENLAEEHDFNGFSEGKTDPSHIIKFWPFIRAALVLAKESTGPKGDARIDKIIAWGDGLSLFGGLLKK